MEKFAIKLDICLKIEGPNLFFEKFVFDKHYKLVSKSQITEEATIRIVLGTGISVTWDKEDNLLTICCVEIDNSVLKLVNTMINSLIIKELEHRKIYMLHASCVYSKQKNRLIILFGDSGAGKTTVMLDLIKKYDLEYVSNGSTLVEFTPSEIKILGSYKNGIKLRASSIREYDNLIFKKYFQDTSHLIKKEIFPNELGLPLASFNNFNAPTISFYFIKLSRSPFIINKDINYRISMTLYNDIVRHIKFSEYYVEVNNKSIFIPSLDSEELFQSRVSFVNHFLKNDYYGFIHGTLVDTINFIGEENGLL